MPQQTLRSKDNERQWICLEQSRLPAQEVKVLRRGGAVRNTNVGGGGQRKKPFGAAAGVIGALTFEAVRKQQDERRRQAPLGAGRDDKFVHHRLSAVDEVAVLRLPDQQSAGFLNVLAIFKRERRVFAQRAVADLEGCPSLRQVLERSVSNAGEGVKKDRVALVESAALGILPGEPDGHAIGEDRREGQLFRRGPVDGPFVQRVEHVTTASPRPLGTDSADEDDKALDQATP